MIDLSKLEERVILAAVSTSETDQAESSLDELTEPGKHSSRNLSGKGKASGTAGNAL